MSESEIERIEIKNRKRRIRRTKRQIRYLRFFIEKIDLAIFF